MEEDSDDEFGLGLPDHFDPGYYGGDEEKGPRRICSECGKPFDSPQQGRRSCLDELCDNCLGEVFAQAAAEAEQAQQIAAGLGIPLEQFLLG